MKGTFNRVIEAVSNIATNLGGEIAKHTGNRLADALEAIASKAEDIGGGGSGGGSGASSSGVLTVRLLPGTDGGYVLDKTWREIYDAARAGAVLNAQVGDWEAIDNLDPDVGADKTTEIVYLNMFDVGYYPNGQDGPAYLVAVDMEGTVAIFATGTPDGNATYTHEDS